MEDGLVPELISAKSEWSMGVLILIVVEDGLVLDKVNAELKKLDVLILIVVEDGLVQNTNYSQFKTQSSLNPYCSGRWSRTGLRVGSTKIHQCLNPYCSGRWSRTWRYHWTL